MGTGTRVDIPTPATTNNPKTRFLVRGIEDEQQKSDEPDQAGSYCKHVLLGNFLCYEIPRKAYTE